MSLFHTPLSASDDLNTLLGPDATSDVPFVRAIMISTLNGSATVHGTSQSLGNATDSELLQALRRWSDVILVGSSTVKAEDYGGNHSLGLKDSSPAPIAILSKSLDLNPDSRVFKDAASPPLILTPASNLQNSSKKELLGLLRNAGAKIVSTGTGSSREVIESLHSLGLRRITCEGGPTVLSALIQSDLIDQLYLTLDPTIGSRIETPLVRSTSTAESGSSSPTTLRDLKLENVSYSDDGTVFLRYGRRANA